MISFLILAQARLPEIVPSFLSSWIGVLLLFGGLVLMILTIAEKLRAKKAAPVKMEQDPLRVEGVQPLATRAELEAMAAAVESDIEELRKTVAEERRVARVANGNLHKRIDDLVEAVAQTKGLLAGVKDNTDRLLARSMK